MPTNRILENTRHFAIRNHGYKTSVSLGRAASAPGFASAVADRAGVAPSHETAAAREPEHYNYSSSPVLEKNVEDFFSGLTRELKQQREFFEDCFADKGDIRFQILEPDKFFGLSEEYRRFLEYAKGNGDDFIAKGGEKLAGLNVVLRCRDRVGKKWMMIPTMHAWEQIVDDLKFSKKVFKSLVEKGNPHLLVENLNFFMDCANSEVFLLRFMSFSHENLEEGRGGKGDQTNPFVLRAFLPSKFSRMDNIYLCDALRETISGSLPAESKTPAISNISYSLSVDGGMLVDIEFSKRHMLTVLKEEYVSGIRVRASETGRYGHITVQTMIKRLVCLNGMTVDAEGQKTLISYSDNVLKGMDKKRCPNLPPHPMPDVQHEINLLIGRIIVSGLDNGKKAMDEFSKNADRFIGEAASAVAENFTEDDVRRAVAYILKRAGLNAFGGVRSADIVKYYYLERERNPAVTNVGWLLLNAITRYATHDIMHANLNLAQEIQRAAVSQLLNPRRITWANIWEEVRAGRRIHQKASVPGVGPV